MLQLEKGFREGLGSALTTYGSDVEKTKAFDGIQHNVSTNTKIVDPEMHCSDFTFHPVGLLLIIPHANKITLSVCHIFYKHTSYLKDEPILLKR